MVGIYLPISYFYFKFLHLTIWLFFNTISYVDVFVAINTSNKIYFREQKFVLDNQMGNAHCAYMSVV